MDDDSIPRLALDVTDAEWRRLVPDVEMRLAAALAALLRGCPGLPAHRFEVSVVLADDATVRQLNARHRGRDRPTDVLSFPQFEADELRRIAPEGPPLPLGDVILARETVVREARALGRPVGDHLVHLFVHGVLHLLGHDHAAEEEAARMEQLETAILAELGLPDPYAREVRK